MFSGIGGFELGIKRAIPDAEFVGYSEVDKYAIKIYERRFKGVRNYGDATKINERELPDFDLLVGGFPCQAFSIAGKRKGFEDTRGTLFFDIARILAYKKPKHIVLENVRGLFSHDSGRTFQTIIGILSDLGYMVQWELLNSKNYGVAQNRERVYIIGSLGSGSRRQVLPIRNISEEDTGENKAIELTKGVSQAYRVYDSRGLSTTLRANGGGIGAKTGLYSIFTKFRDGKMFIDDRSTCLDANYYKGFDNMGQRSGAARVLLEERRLSLDKSTIRRLTPLECERLQGFPDGWTDGLSDTQRYKTLGNAVTTNVVYEVIKRMYL
jgi:DNA (cytosine-5)-methyltransferase 1